MNAGLPMDVLDAARARLVDHYADAQARGVACEPGTGPNVTGAVVFSTAKDHPIARLQSLLYDGRDFYGWFLDGEGYELIGD